MKIAIYKDTFANNRGADLAVRNLAAGLSERGHAVTLFDKSEFAEKVRGDYDVIISTGTNEILDLADVDGLPPIIQQFHTDPKYPFRHWIKRWRRNRAIKAALRKAAAFQVLCDSHVGKLRKLLGGASADRSSVIGNWSSYEGCELQNVKSEKIIICPGAINKDKNQSLLINAFAELAEEFPDWQVHIYGKGKPKAETALLKLIASKGLSVRVLFKGYADLARPYADCAFVAFPSTTEGFPLTILDAAMFAKPSLTVCDWIGMAAHGSGVVTAATADDYAEGLRRLMSDMEGCRTLGRRAREYGLKRYSREVTLDKWSALLERVSVRALL